MFTCSLFFLSVTLSLVTGLGALLIPSSFSSFSSSSSSLLSSFLSSIMSGSTFLFLATYEIKSKIFNENNQ